MSCPSVELAVVDRVGIVTGCMQTIDMAT